jgi:60 kDa SS-A/Ro ribonucleoprotein
MADKTLFSSIKSRLPRANARNEAGGPAYRLPAKHALAQVAATGCAEGAVEPGGRPHACNSPSR